jgi:uncharacterized membrane protein YkvA (DUF1232 family)
VNPDSVYWNVNQATRFAVVAKDNSKPVWVRWVAVFCLVYVISPIDFLPDIIPVIGWLDDIIVILTTVTSILSALRNSRTSVPPVLPRQ